MGKLIINGPVSIECETGNVSDGYHSFDELYDHRCLLFLAFQALSHRNRGAHSTAWKSRKHHDGSAFDGWFIAGMELANGQVSYHIPEKYWDLCHGWELETAPKWDGHTSQDVVERLRLYLGVKASPQIP